MNRFLPFVLVFFWGALGLSAPAFGGEKNKTPPEHTPTEQILDFSLTRVKESVEKTVQKNSRIAYENDVLRQGIGELRRKRDALSVQWEGLSGGSRGPAPVVRGLTPAEAGERMSKTRELTAFFEKDVARSRQRVQEMERGVDGANPSVDKRSLLAKQKTLKKAVSRVERDLRVQNKKNQKPRQTVLKLKAEQENLRKKLGAWRGDLFEL